MCLRASSRSDALCLHARSLVAWPLDAAHPMWRTSAAQRGRQTEQNTFMQRETQKLSLRPAECDSAGRKSSWHVSLVGSLFSSGQCSSFWLGGSAGTRLSVVSPHLSFDRPAQVSAHCEPAARHLSSTFPGRPEMLRMGLRGVDCRSLLERMGRVWSAPAICAQPRRRPSARRHR